MMEPIAALSLASNVIQVVNFSAGIVSKSSELYKSHNGRLAQHTDIATTSSDLNQLTSKLSASIAPPSVPTVLFEDDFALHALCKRAIDVSQELQDGLNKLQVNGAPSKWKSLRKALKSIWGKERIAQLESRLAAYRDELDSRILIGIKSRLDLVELQQAEGFDKLDDGIKALVQIILDASTSVKLHIYRRSTITDAATEANIRLAQNNIVEVVDDAARAQQGQLQSVDAQLSVLQVSGEQNLAAIHESRDEVVANIACAAAVSSEEHEQMKAELTEQWKSAEEQIAQLRTDILQLEGRIAESIQRAVSSGANPQNRRQKKMNEETNLLYKLLVAKDLMLQKLLVSLNDMMETTQRRTHVYHEGTDRIHKKSALQRKDVDHCCHLEAWTLRKNT